MPVLHTNSDYRTYIKERIAAWKAARNTHAGHTTPSGHKKR
jgi:hypothetical protein